MSVHVPQPRSESTPSGIYRPAEHAYNIMRCAVVDAISFYRADRPGFADYTLRKGMAAAGRAGRGQS